MFNQAIMKKNYMAKACAIIMVAGFFANGAIAQTASERPIEEVISQRSRVALNHKPNSGAKGPQFAKVLPSASQLPKQAVEAKKSNKGKHGAMTTSTQKELPGSSKVDLTEIVRRNMKYRPAKPGQSPFIHKR